MRLEYYAVREIETHHDDPLIRHERLGEAGSQVSLVARLIHLFETHELDA